MSFFIVNANGEVKESREKATHGINLNESINYKVSKYSAVVTDLSCENVFESVNYVDNALQLGKIQLAGMANKQDMKSVLQSVSRQMVWAPRWLEEKYAEKLHKDRLAANNIIDEGDLTKSERTNLKRIEGILKQIVDNLPSDSDYTFRLFVSDDPGVNAIAIPAGYIYITRDAVKSVNFDMVAFLLAHEVAHITKRHQVKEFQVRLTDGMTGVSDVQAIMSGSESPAAIVGAMRYAVAVKNLLDDYSVAQESEADGCAVKLLANQNGINVTKGVTSFIRKEKGLKLRKGETQSHPSYENRQQLILAAYAKFSATRYVGDKSDSLNKTIAGSSPLQAASDKNTEIVGDSEQSSGFSGWLSGVGNSIGSVFSSSNKSDTPEKNGVKNRKDAEAN